MIPAMSESEARRGRVDVVIVGAGPAGLAAAIHLAREGGRRGSSPLKVLVLDKAPSAGLQVPPAAFLDTRGLDLLFPGWASLGAPRGSEAHDGGLLRFWPERSKTLRPGPAALRRGSGRFLPLRELVGWMASIAEESGIEIAFGTAVCSLLNSGRGVCGVHTGSRGVSANGSKGKKYQAGEEIPARLTLVADGARGAISSQLLRLGRLRETRNAELYSAAVSERWQLPEPRLVAGRFRKVFGWPLPESVHGNVHIDELAEDQLSLTLSASLDGPDPALSPLDLLSIFRGHPVVAPLLDGASLVSRGAGLLPDAGYWSVPKLATEGALLLGSAAGLFNSGRGLGVHLAIESGVAAAETALAALADDDLSAARLMRYDRRVRDGSLGQELFTVRNLRQGFQKGLAKGLAHAVAQSLSRGRGTSERYPVEEAHLRRTRLAAAHPSELVRLEMESFGDLPQRAFRKGQPANLVILDQALCSLRCREEFGNPCLRFCPAGVFVAEGAESEMTAPHIEARECLHCMICTEADPYGIILWAPPEGGDGPRSAPAPD